MTRYGSKAWLSKMENRRAIRDHYRDKFFSDHGFSQRLKDPFEVALNPADQLKTVQTLIEKASSNVEADTQALDALKSTILSAALGSTAFSTPISPFMKLPKMEISALVRAHFNSSSGPR